MKNTLKISLISPILCTFVFASNIYSMQITKKVTGHSIQTTKKIPRPNDIKDKFMLNNLDIMKMTNDEIIQCIEKRKKYLQENNKYQKLTFDNTKFPVTNKLTNCFNERYDFINSLLNFLVNNYSSNNIIRIINKLLQENISCFLYYNDTDLINGMSLSSLFYYAWMIILNYIVIHNLDDILHNRIVSLIQHVLSLINEKFDSYAYKDKLNDKQW